VQLFFAFRIGFGGGFPIDSPFTPDIRSENPHFSGTVSSFSPNTGIIWFLAWLRFLKKSPRRGPPPALFQRMGLPLAAAGRVFGRQYFCAPNRCGERRPREAGRAILSCCAIAFAKTTKRSGLRGPTTLKTPLGDSERLYRNCCRVRKLGAAETNASGEVMGDMFLERTGGSSSSFKTS